MSRLKDPVVKEIRRLFYVVKRDPSSGLQWTQDRIRKHISDTYPANQHVDRRHISAIIRAVIWQHHNRTEWVQEVYIVTLSHVHPCGIRTDGIKRPRQAPVRHFDPECIAIS